MLLQQIFYNSRLTCSKIKERKVQQSVTPVTYKLSLPSSLKTVKKVENMERNPEFLYLSDGGYRESDFRHKTIV